MIERNEREEALRRVADREASTQMALGKRVALDALYWGVPLRIVSLSMFTLGYEKDPFTEKDIDALIAKEWGPRCRRNR